MKKALDKVQRIRGRKLQRIRREHLKENPLCVECEKEGTYVPAVEIDHIIALANGGQETKSNRQGLCKDHHDKKTKLDLKYKPKVKIGIDGFPIED
jgi:5-methylcytosine-specific restriction protein A